MVAIANETTRNHTIGAAEQGDYLFFCVTPVAVAGVTTGVEACSPATAAVAAAAVVPPPVVELIPPLPNAPVAGVSGAPTLLNMGQSRGTDVIAGVVNTLAPVLGSGLLFVEQTPSGTVVIAAPNGQNVVFAPLSVTTNDPRPDGLYPVGNGQYQIVAAGTALLVMPVLQNMAEVAAVLPGGSSIRQDSNGVLVAQVDGLTYVVQPAVFVDRQANPSCVPSIFTGADGNLRFMYTSGNVQILYPVFAESAVLSRILLTLDSHSTVSIQLDGTAQIHFQGQNLVLVPDVTLGGVPAGRESDYWWQEGATRYRVRIQANWFTFQTQGFGVR